MLVVELRRALAPFFSGQETIHTVPGHGYGLSVPYEPCDFPSELANSTMTRTGMTIALAAPTLLSSGPRAVELGACFRDTLLNTLGSAPQLKVSTREASLGTDADGFTFIIQSSVRVVKREVLLSVRCVDPRSQEICWAASERAPLVDALEAETRLCGRLLRELQSTESGFWGRQTWKHYRQSSGFDALLEGQRLVAARDATSFPGAEQDFARHCSWIPAARRRWSAWLIVTSSKRSTAVWSRWPRRSEPLPISIEPWSSTRISPTPIRRAA
jgi:TolB-like protein